jgi:hypothetical protein
MDDSFWLFWELAMHLWQLWGIAIFGFIPLFIGVAAFWDFVEFRNEKGQKHND